MSLKKMIKTLIFDLDGTLLNTLEDINDSLNETLIKYNYKEISIEETKQKIGRGYYNLIKSILPNDIDQEKINKISLEYKDKYNKNCMNKTKPYKGIKGLLFKIQEQKINLTINTNKSEKIAKILINQYFQGIIFEEIVGRREDLELKPSPKGVFEIIKKLNLKKEEILYIGDSEHDIQTAHNAGITSVACLWGYRDIDILKNEKPEYMISHPDEILKIINEH